MAISDDGHGIPAADLEAIFQPYFTTKATGTGLGLFVCRNILEESGEGRIELTRTVPARHDVTVFVTCEMIREHADIPLACPIRPKKSPHRQQSFGRTTFREEPIARSSSSRMKRSSARRFGSS